MGRIVVFGAAGRAGRAVVAEAGERGHGVTAVGRTGPIGGDVTDPVAVAALSAGHDAVVAAVSPATGPAELLAGDWDREFFVKAADAVLGAGVPRVVFVGLFATLRTPSGGLVLDDPTAFPPELREFALAHAAGLERFRASRTAVDWLVVTPPADLRDDGTRTGRYRTGGEAAPGSPLSYRDLAVAVVDEAVSPRHHRTRISVFS
ncbi:NAD(P)-dependent oxidoreductase [Saccharothrix variisporea]|uniref:NAD(P)-binding domain-containing protein n=1 Tax=Saccharothrix variisporea TaxID=543527 RepID=A0A495XDM1_9PSEU|nr:NAD(P)H-binding protein [Saccharothrix variisporea]RKT70924.1 hypothetical protein DFJ66_4201 [Saccharothrix variisporea]